MNRAPDFVDQRQMRPRRAIPFVLAALLAFAGAPARATLEHTYAKGEYAVIRDGLSPDGRKSLAAHGDGEAGDDNFHVWLMAEPAHRRIEALEGYRVRQQSRYRRRRLSRVLVGGLARGRRHLPYQPP